MLIEVTLFGIVIFVSDEHPENVFFEITFTPSRIVISEIFLKTEKISLKLFTATFGIVIFISDEHPEKAREPIEVTLFGIVIFVSDEH